MKFVIFIAGSVMAFFILKYRRQVKDFIGDVGFAEKILGTGGTNTFVVILAIGIFIGSLMYALGTFQGLIQSALGRFF